MGSDRRNDRLMRIAAPAGVALAVLALWHLLVVA
jgi:hypothetical protein